MKTSFACGKNQFSLSPTPSKPKFLPQLHAARQRWIGRALASFSSFLFIGSLYAQPLYVGVSSAQYTTYVEGQGAPTTTYPPVSRTTMSAFPISDEMAFPLEEGFGAGGTNYAIANAGLFGVSDRTGWGFANAEAVSQLWFSPLADQTQALNVQINAQGAGLSFSFTSGQISLFDLTANSELWNYSWNAGGSAMVPVPVPSGDNIPWDGPYSPTANFDLNTDFLALHQYELTMIVCSNAGDDTEIVQIQLTGLQEVPEPSSVGLLLPAALGLAAARLRARQ